MKGRTMRDLVDSRSRGTTVEMIRRRLMRNERRIKDLVKSVIDNRLLDYHMPAEMPGDLLITFDDGPDPDWTPRLLNVLDDRGIRAIFFVIGERAAEHKDLLREYHLRGHVIANHTYTHLNQHKGGRYSAAMVKEEIIRCSDLIQSITGRPTHLFRPPRGELNHKIYRAAHATGHRLMLWSIEGGEWGRRAHWPVGEISSYVKANIRKRDILLLHDNEASIRVMSDLFGHVGNDGFDLWSAVKWLRTWSC